MALNINGTTGISGVEGSVSAPVLTGTDSNCGISFPAADTIKFSTGGVERMQITNSGVSGTGVGGKILQYKVTKKTDSVSTSSQSYSEISSDFRITLTPTASDSTIVVTAYLMVANQNNANTFRLRRNTASDFSGTSTEVIQPDTFLANEDGVCSVYEGGSHIFTLPVTGWEISGNTTARTYSPFWRVGGGTMYLGRLYNSASYHGVSTMTVMEIGA